MSRDEMAAELFLRMTVVYAKVQTVYTDAVVAKACFDAADAFVAERKARTTAPTPLPISPPPR